MRRAVSTGALFVLSLATVALALQASQLGRTSAGQPPAATAPHLAQSAAPLRPAPEFFPDGLRAVRRWATTCQEFQLDQAALNAELSSTALAPELRHAAASVDFLAIHTFAFDVDGHIAPTLMAEIDQQYRAAGWLHLLRRHQDQSGSQTDLWIFLDHATVRHLAVLVVGRRQVDFVSVSGTLTPLELVRLSGRLGIPTLDRGIAIPLSIVRH